MPATNLARHHLNNPALSTEFLTRKPQNAAPVSIKRIEWSETDLVQYTGKFAAVIDNVLSEDECVTLLQMAEASMRNEPGEESWRPALVKTETGDEILQRECRNGERIMWDNQDVVDCIWERCIGAAPCIKDELAVITGDSNIFGLRSRGVPSQQWKFRRVNKRMRFLRYHKGGYFRR